MGIAVSRDNRPSLNLKMDSEKDLWRTFERKEQLPFNPEYRDLHIERIKAIFHTRFETPRILLLGPIASGKSSLLSSLASIDKGRIANQRLVGSVAESPTTKAEIPENKLTISLEPEAASLYCRHLPVEKCGIGKTSLASFGPLKRNLFLDAGGQSRMSQFKKDSKVTFRLHTALADLVKQIRGAPFSETIQKSTYARQYRASNIKDTDDRLSDRDKIFHIFLRRKIIDIEVMETKHSLFLKSVAMIGIENQPKVCVPELYPHIPKNEFAVFKTTHEMDEDMSTDEGFSVNDVMNLIGGNMRPCYKFDQKSPEDISDERNFENDPTLNDRCHCVCLVSDSSLVIDTVSALDKDIKEIKMLQQYLQFYDGVTVLVLTKDIIHDEKNTTAENEVSIKKISLDTKPWYLSHEVKKEGEQFLRKECQETERKIKDVLEKETPRLEHLVMCKICLDVDASVVFLPCTHMVACGLCAGYLQQCPLCRAMIDKVLYINLQ